MPSALIIGASRGIGLGLAAECMARGWTVVATHRSPAPALAATGATTALADIDDGDSIAALAAAHGRHGFDHVVINAGITVPAATTASTTTRETMAQLFWTNAIAPVRAARLLLPLVKDGGSIAFMTSVLGSVGGRTRAYAELYSASKAALNSLTRSFVLQDVGTRDIAVINFHPGWVRTAMGGDSAAIDVATSAKGLIDQIERVRGPGQRYIDYSGAPIPW